MSFTTQRHLIMALAEAADAECRKQTPPRGPKQGWYQCPACPQQRQIRGDFRGHLQMCDKFRERVFARTVAGTEMAS
jgi:hypothetical protein